MTCCQLNGSNMTSWCDATSHIYMKNGLKSQWGIVCVPHKSTKYRVGIQVMRPTPCGAIIQMHPSTTTTTTLQLFNINIKVKRQEKGLEVMSCYIQTNTKPWHIHPPPPLHYPSIATPWFSKGLWELLSESQVPRSQATNLKLLSSKALML